MSDSFQLMNDKNSDLHLKRNIVCNRIAHTQFHSNFFFFFLTIITYLHYREKPFTPEVSIKILQKKILNERVKQNT